MTRMKVIAVLVLLVVAGVIYTLPQSGSNLWSSQLERPHLQSTLRKNLPQFEWQDGDKSLKSSDLRQKWFLLSFWAYWCPPCLEEMPKLNELDQNWVGPELDVITVNVDDPKSENFELAKKLLADNAMTVTVLFDTKGELKKTFAVNELPRHFLVNPQGEIIWEATGAFDWSQAATRKELLRLLEPEQTPEPAE